MTESSKPGDTPADEVGVRLPEWPPLASYDEPTEVPKRATSNLGDSPYPDGFRPHRQTAQRTARSSTSWTGWRVEWTWPSGQKLTEVWNGSLSSSGASVTVTNMSYNGTLAPDGTTTFGFLADITGTNPAPTMTCAGR